jgi:hypothetical protein
VLAAEGVGKEPVLQSPPPVGDGSHEAPLDGLTISPWAGLGVLAARAGGALLVGGLAFRLRDA